jgi:hypothetical protein
VSDCLTMGVVVCEFAEAFIKSLIFSTVNSPNFLSSNPEEFPGSSQCKRCIVHQVCGLFIGGFLGKARVDRRFPRQIEKKMGSY